MGRDARPGCAAGKGIDPHHQAGDVSAAGASGVYRQGSQP